MATAGLSTLGVKFGYGVETIAGTQPTDFIVLNRINAIGGISLTTEQIDASALEDLISRYTAGRQDPGGEWTITVNLTDETAKEWNDLITASQAGEATGLATWFVVYHPSMTKSFFVVAQPPKNIPMPEFGQNALLTVEMTLTIQEYKGMLAAVEPDVPAGP